VSRYDLLLLALPTPLLCGAVWGALASIPVALAVGLAGLPSIALLLYAMFVDAPTPATAGARPDARVDASPQRGLAPSDD
jgi:hypothetical protein